MTSESKRLLRQYLEDLDLVGHNIDSFDQAIDDLVCNLNGKKWSQTSKLNPESKTAETVYNIRLDGFRLLNPTIYNEKTARDEKVMPRRCIEGNITYAGKFVATVHASIENFPNNPSAAGVRTTEVLDPQEVELMSIPIPIGSRFCNARDHALHPDVFPNRGAFIVNGQRKNAISFVTAAMNVPVMTYDPVEGYMYEIRSHSCPWNEKVITATVYSNVVWMKGGVVLFSSRTFRQVNKGTNAVTLVNVLANLGLSTQEEIAAALLGPEPDEELREALALTMTNTDDFPALLENPRALFGVPPASMISHLGRRPTGASGPPHLGTDAHADWAQSILDREILPHCGDNNAAKILILCRMARRIALSTFQRSRGKEPKIDNRDDISNKYVKGYGDLITELVLEGMKTIRDNVWKGIRKSEGNNHAPLTKATLNVGTLSWYDKDAMKTIGNGQMKRPMTRGKTSFVASKAPKRTVTQSYGQINISADIASLRNMKKTLPPQSKQLDPRTIQESQLMYQCPTATREGQEVGLDDEMALMATTTLHGIVETVISVISQFGEDRTRPLEPLLAPDDFIICINGAPYRLVKFDDAAEFIDFLRDARRSGHIEPFTSIAVGAPFESGSDVQEIHIRLNAGRLSAVLMILDDSGTPLYRRRDALVRELESLVPTTPDEIESVRSLKEAPFWDYVLPRTVFFRGKIYELPAAAEWIDPFERRNVFIAENPDQITPMHTHMMIHPTLILGSSAAEVPFPDHNQSPRNSYQCGMGKQAIAGRRLTRIISTNVPGELLYPQKPLVSTEFSKVLHEKHPCPTGANAVVAIMPQLYNQEDAVIISRRAIDFGMFVSTHYIVESDKAKNTDGVQSDAQAERFAFPDPATVCQGFPSGMSFDNIDSRGIVVPGTCVVDGDPLICKLRKFQSSHHECFLNKRGLKCQCTYAMVVTQYRGNDVGIVDDVQVTHDAQGDMIVNVVVRYYRAPEVGDKLASRHGQKGVIGLIVPPEDLPFSMEDGMSPDIIINPHAIPSRMTVAHLLETFAGAWTCVKGDEIDATPFGEDSRERWTAYNLAKAFKAHGMSEYCEKTYACGKTGEMMEGTVFTGPIFYQRLKQHVSDKVHSRNRGPIVTNTRQPVGGRSSNGGKRLGGMELNCLSEEHQILTDRGFMFLHEIESVPLDSLLFASMTEDERLVYEPAYELIVNESSTRLMYEFTHPAEQSCWGPESDSYGRRDYPTDGTRVLSNHVSFVVTGGHDIFCTLGRRTKAQIHWKPGGYEKIKAEELFTIGDSPLKEMKFMGQISGGLAVTNNLPAEIIERLSLTTPEKVSAFCELYGFFLGDGTLTFRAYTGYDAVSFHIVKRHDVDWMSTLLSTLGLVRGTDFNQSRTESMCCFFITNPSWVDVFFREYRHNFASGDPRLVRPTTVDGRSKGAGARMRELADELPLPSFDKEFASVSSSKSSFMQPEAVKSAKWFAFWSWELNKDLMRHILAGLRRADGCEKAGHNIIYTSSVRFRDELVRFCLHAGYSARFSSMYRESDSRGIGKNGKEIIARHDSWAVSYPDHGHFANPILSREDIKEIPYTGRTWCVSLPHTLIITRRAYASENRVLKASMPIVMGNCLTSHGASMTVVERFMHSSDPYNIYVCTECNNPCIGNADEARLVYRCDYCGHTDPSKMTIVKMTYAGKLLIQQIQAMNIGVEIVTK